MEAIWSRSKKPHFILSGMQRRFEQQPKKTETRTLQNHSAFAGNVRDDGANSRPIPTVNDPQSLGDVSKCR